MKLISAESHPLDSLGCTGLSGFGSLDISGPACP